MPLLALRKFRSHISKKYFYTLGIKIASHPYYVLCISLLIICFISYSVFIDYFIHTYSLSPPLIDGHLWQFSSHLQKQETTDPGSLIAQQIRVISPENTLSKQLLGESLAIYQSLTVSNQLKTICATTQHRQCIVHSILGLWDYSQQKIDADLDILGTINQHVQDVSKTTGLSLHPYTTLGNVSLDSHGSFLSANSIILTFILKNTSKTQEIWDQLWQRSSVSSRNILKLGIEPCLIQYKLKLLAVSPTTSLFILAFGIGVFFLVKYQFATNSRLIKSTSGLGITILFLSLTCYTTTVGVKNINRTPWWYLAVCTTATLEHALLLTGAVVVTSTRDSMTVKERIAKGLQQAGVTMTTSLLSELCILGTGSLMKEDNVRLFCSFTAVALVIAFILSLTFFVAVLSIDIRRAELTDLDNCDGLERRRRSSTFSASQFIYGRNFKSKRAINALFLCIILFLLNVLPSNANPGKELTSTIKLEKTQWASISNLFWSVLNPTYETQSLQVYAPYIVVASLNNDSIQDSSTLLQNLTMYYTDKFSLLRQYLQARSMQYSWLDALHPYRLITYFSHYRNLLPSIILLLVWIGIMLWMNTFVREQYMLPIMRVAFVRIVTFFLRIIARVTSIQTDSLIRKVETEYNEDGMHLGAISLHSQFHLQQTRDRVPNVSIRTLFGEHSADIKDMACGGGTETGRKLVSTDQDGRLVLWNITEEVDTAIARLDQQRQLGGGLNGWMGTRYQQKGQTPIELRQLPPARCVQMESQGKFVIAGYEQGYICIWNAETAHVVRELYVQDAPKESRNNRVMHLLFLEPKETNIKKKKPSSSKYILSAHKNGYLREWNIKTGEMIKSFDSNHKRDISAIHVLADNQHPHKLWIFTASKDGIVKCWERTFIAGHDMQPTTNWQCLYSIQAHNGHMITSLAAHQLHNGMGILVTGSSGGGVCVWQLTSGKPLGVLSNDSADGKASQNQKDGLLLQFSRVAQQQDNSLRQRQSQTQGLARADHGRSVNQVVITRLACPEFDNDMCDNCQTTLNTGFLVASCALDDSVHCWRLDRTMRNDVGCTRCIKEYQHRPYHCQAPVPPTTTGPPRASQRKKRNNNNHQSQSGDESEDETELLSLSVSFLGKLDQVDGQGLVFCDNMVLAGVRRRQIRLDNNDDADLWEAWFVSLQYYEPPPIKEEEDAFFIPVIAFDLEKDEEYYREIEEKEMLHDQELAKSSSLWDHLLLNIFGIKKVRAATWPIEATTITTRKRSLKNEPLLDTDVNGKDEDAYEILPFSTIRLVLSMKGFGFYCEYGNFIKLVSFGNPDEIHSSTASTSSR